jgi:hypothetical protein
MEGIPDHHEASAFTRRRQRWSRRSPHPPTRTNQPKDGRTARLQLPGNWERRGDELGIATGVSEARSRRHRGTKTLTLVTLQKQGRETRSTSQTRVSNDDPPKRSYGRRETSGPPVIPRGALVSAGCPRRESGESEPGTHEVRVHVVRLGGRHRLDASRVFSTGRSQGLLVKREGASRREVRSTA